MSSITPEERHKVVERLRLYADDFDFGESNPYWYMQKAVFGDIQIHDDCKLFARLADLIEPTCHQVIEDETQVCSECSEDLDEGYGWDFCPDCGARVVRDEA